MFFHPFASGIMVGIQPWDEDERMLTPEKNECRVEKTLEMMIQHKMYFKHAKSNHDLDEEPTHSNSAIGDK